MNIWKWPQDRDAILAFFDRATETPPQIESTVARTIEAVRKGGDQAVARLTNEVHGTQLKDGPFDVDATTLEDAWNATPAALKRALRNARRRIETFHRAQRLKGWKIVERGFGRLEQRVVPLERVAVWVPAGRAPLPSTVLMDVIPARAAGVDEIILVTPPRADGTADPGILAAAHLVGVSRVLCVSGVPALAALAYGTETIPRVDKVVGPGSIYVTTAKKQLYGRFDIDGVAGPSEVLVIADARAPVEYVAADMLAQAEHGEDSSAGAILIGGGKRAAERLAGELHGQLGRLERSETAEASLREHGYIISVAGPEHAVELANRKAPEHLEIMTDNARALAGHVRHAGAIFVGPYTPETLGDYIAGPNHTLPTGGTARFFSPLSVWAFYKTSHTIEARPGGLAMLAEDAITLAETEGLTAHAEAIRIRLKR